MQRGLVRCRFASAAAGVIALATFAGSRIIAQQTTFRSEVGAVALYASVVDRDGRLVPDLQQTDFEVFDNGKPVELTLFSNEPQPATVALLLDMSDSIVTKVTRVRDAAEQFIGALQPSDRIRLGTFGGEIAISPRLTGDRAVLSQLLKEELWPGGATPLWNALYAGMQSLDAEGGRRVVLSLTDGTNSASLPGWPGSLAEVERKAIDDDFMIYAIGMEGSGLESRVVKLAENTGGGHFEVKRDADLAATFTRVADELRRQYLLGFVPGAADGKSHALDVRVKKPGLKARARKSYVQGRTSVVAHDAPMASGAVPPAPRSSGQVIDATMQVLVLGADGQPIAGLTANDFRVTEAGQARSVSLVPPAAGTVAVVIDTSLGNDEAAGLAITAPDVQRFLVGQRYGPSAIWDGIDTAITALEKTAGTKGVVVVSDGRATGNKIGPADVSRHAWRAGVPVSAIVTAPSQSFTIGKNMLLLVHPEFSSQTVAADTGGQYVGHPAGSGLPSLTAKVERIADELRKSYVLKFPAPADGLAHRVTVTVTRPGASVRVAKAYVPGVI